MINMFPNQDIKPLLPAINSQRSPVYYRPQQPNYGVYSTNYQVAYLPPIAYEPQPILPPLQFYSATGTSPSPHPDNRENSNYKLNYNHNLNYQVSPPTGAAESIVQVVSPRFNSVSPSNSADANHRDMSINYSSIINYTISPSLKRKRRSKAIIETSPIQTQLPCPKCGKVFQKPYNLKSHMKSHSDEKPFKCNICSKTFARSHDKKRHELLHNGEKNFKCEGYLKDGKTKWGCGKQFARSDALSRHFRTETGWVCIRPLMDEAKTLEANGVINDILNNRQ